MVSINARIHALTDLFYFLFRDQTILTDKRSRRRKFITYANYLTVNKSFRYFSKNLKILESQKKQKENMFDKKMTLNGKYFIIVSNTDHFIFVFHLFTLQCCISLPSSCIISLISSFIISPKQVNILYYHSYRNSFAKSKIINFDSS